MSKNPDFRGVDEIRLPVSIRSMPGWTDGISSTERDLINTEKKVLGQLEEEQPLRFVASDEDKFMPEMLAKWKRFLKFKGRTENSSDWSLLDEFMGSEEGFEGSFTPGKSFNWLPQIIGSCVLSNTFRQWVKRMMIQIILFGQPMEYLGKAEFSSNNLSFYAPWSYGHARKLANMRGGDGLYCGPAVKSLMSGVVMCNNPALLSILQQEQCASEKDFPEPQGGRGSALYRAFGNWKYIDQLEPYKDFELLESPSVKSADQLWNLIQKGYTAFVCSGEAIKKVGIHPDGFAIHARDPSDSWPHNMGVGGCFEASDRDRFFVWDNTSWGANHLYYRRFAEVEQSFRAGRLTMQAIGQISGPTSSPPKLI